MNRTCLYYAKFCLVTLLSWRWFGSRMLIPAVCCWLQLLVESSWNVTAHGDAREGKWRGNWRMEWVGLFTLPRNTVYPALLLLMRTPRLSVVDWTEAPADLNGLVRFAERQNLVSARVPSHFKRSLHNKIPYNRAITLTPSTQRWKENRVTWKRTSGAHGNVHCSLRIKVHLPLNTP